MALKRNVARGGKEKWPELTTRVVPAAHGGGLVFQVTVQANGRRVDASARIAVDGGIESWELGRLLRDVAWSFDGQGEPPAWELDAREKRRKQKLAGMSPIRRQVARVLGAA